MLQIALMLLCTAAAAVTAEHGFVQYPEVYIHRDGNVITKYIGVQTESWKGDVFHAFRGIPYAFAPIGERRFKDPEPLIHSTSSEVDARFEGNDCPSIYARNSSEDCLLLNVYTKWNGSTQSGTHPVIVFIHPGGLYIGSGLSSLFGPQYLMAKDIILVTFNYRLGALGFLNLGTKDIPGNAGFKDQVLALRWIKNNIEHFGGNATDVTLMGYSAGALSASLHLVSPLSKQLFQKAIIMSGSIPPQLKLPRHNQRALAMKQASVLGCNLTNSSASADGADIVDCLNQFPGNAIANTLRKMFTFGRDNPIYLWLPVVEENFGQERFLVEDFYESLEAGRFAKVPLLYGSTNGELCTSARDIIVQKNLLSRFNSEFEQLAPILFMYEELTNMQTVNVTSSIRAHYFPTNTATGPGNFSDFRALCDVFSDAIIRFGQHKLAKIVSQSGLPTYPYRFSYRGRHSNLHFAWNNLRRAEHMDDLMYLFRTYPHTFRAKDPESHVVEMMIDFFTEFAKTGKPPQGDLFSFANNKFSDIYGAKIRIESGANFQNAGFWDELFRN